MDPGLLILGLLLLAGKPSLRVWLTTSADDGPDVVRVVAPGPRLMGIFSSEANARAAIKAARWQLISDEIQPA